MSFEPQTNAKGERLVWLETAAVDRLAGLRGPGESYSDVILRLVDLEPKGRHLSMRALRRKELVGATCLRSSGAGPSSPAPFPKLGEPQGDHDQARERDGGNPDR